MSRKTRKAQIASGSFPHAREDRAAKGPLASAQGARAAGAPAPPLVSGRWLLSAVVLVILAAVFCGWCALCLLFWQGSWQLLYHPAAAVARTPASAGLAFDAVEFAATDAGEARLKGWWIPAAPGATLGRFTVVYLHGQDGNLGDTVDALARLHRSGVNVLAFDYRGYGASQFARPSEAHWRQDTEWALEYLTGTRHVDAGAIVLDGTDLGANLALEVAAAHPELAGVVLDAPIEAPMNAIFNDARARMVPVRLLVSDRYDLDAAAAPLRVPLLWFEREVPAEEAGSTQEPEAYQRVAARKMLVWINPAGDVNKEAADAMGRWLDGLPVR